MKSIVRILSIVFSCSLIISCGPKYTASFGPSQKFYKPEKQKLEETQNVALEEIDVQNESVTAVENSDSKVSTEDLVASTTMVKESKADKRINEVSEKFKEGGKFDKANIAKMSTSEKKALLKEAKKDIKSLKKESKISNQKIYYGLIIALAGLVVAILVHGGLGGLAILVGIVLIVWGLIEQGSI